MRTCGDSANKDVNQVVKNCHLSRMEGCGRQGERYYMQGKQQGQKEFDGFDKGVQTQGGNKVSALTLGTQICS